MWGTDGTSSTESVRMPALSAVRWAVPIPNAITRPESASGRRASGRRGMNFVSTVIAVIEVPPTQSCGVVPIRPASTAAISSSVASNTTPPLPSISSMVGLRNPAPVAAVMATSPATPTPASAPIRRAAGATPWCPMSSAAPTTALVIASRARVAGEPIRGMTRNGSTNVATIAPVVLTARRAPVADPSRPASSPSRAAVAGNVIPIATVAGRTMKVASAPNSPSDMTKSALAP